MNMFSEREIATALCRQTFASKCLLLVPNCTFTGHECDVLGVDARNLKIIDIKIKVSKADFKKDKVKDKWWWRLGGRYEKGVFVEGPQSPLLHPRMVWKHYYAVPATVWGDDLLEHIHSPASGVITVAEKDGVFSAAVIRRAKTNAEAKPLRDSQIMDIARLASLRMWDAYRREHVALRDAEYWRKQVKAAA